MKELDKSRLEEIAIGVEGYTKNAAESLIHVGRLLCEAREKFPANIAFGEWRKKRLPWLERKVAERWMNAYKNGGENLLRHNVGTTVIYQLTAPSVPEEARREAIKKAETGETITVEKSKELVKRAKAEAVKEALRKDIAKLQPVLAKLVVDGLVSEEVAEEFSLLPEKAQLEIARTYLDKRDEIKRAENDRINLIAERRKLADANERAMKAISEKEQAVETAKELGGKDASERIEELKNELHNLKVTMAEEIQAETRPLVERELRNEYEAKLESANTENDRLTRKLMAAKESIENLSDAELRERARAEQAEQELKATVPAEKDAQHARKLKFIIDDLKAMFEKIKGDCESYQRQQSETKVRELIEEAQNFLGSTPDIIDI